MTAKKPRSKDEKSSEHERELKATKNIREKEKAEPRKDTSSRQRIVPQPRAPERESTLESVVSEERTEKKEESEPTSRLEERVARSTDPKDLERMRRLAERVYHDGWNRLSADEQLAFIHHSRFLEYLSGKERERADVQSTMYRVLGAQGKSLGLNTTYTTREMSMIADRFFGQIATPQNSDLYKRPLTDSYKAREERR